MYDFANHNPTELVYGKTAALLLPELIKNRSPGPSICTACREGAFPMTIINIPRVPKQTD
jgi:hypothetical protein